ncbi:hypothetical protein CDL12_08576 [Handroanthus impetiginosus]|uniref:Uncharacterized protein n=1 Tax=Handroanthus impetiginosus TaxID=429701 RepID=A0A2G9HMJ4_9LAMI|nr:hypothetical protein CDL12_08576 [Handroanthus impetiginosus]
MCFIFATPKPINVFEDRELIEIFDDQSIPRPREAYNHVPSIPTNVREGSPSSISSSFWNDLPRIVGRSEVPSQDSVQYPSQNNTAFTPNELIVGAYHEHIRTPTQHSCIRHSNALEPSMGEVGCSSHVSSATPKKPDRQCR